MKQMKHSRHKFISRVGVICLCDAPCAETTADVGFIIFRTDGTTQIRLKREAAHVLCSESVIANPLLFHGDCQVSFGQICCNEAGEKYNSCPFHFYEDVTLSGSP